MAEVFRATVGPDPQTYAFDFALKRLHPHLADERSQVEMFMTEADIAKLLRHENIVRVYESGLAEGQAYIAMEYVWGMDLGQVLLRLREQRLRFPTDLAVYVALRVLRALDYVHRAIAPGGEPMNMVHRDVTPSNIYLTYDGEVKLADFGVARVSFLERRDDTTLKGKVSYMPPEVLAGHEVDAMVDTWSLAVTLYELVTQRRLYEGVSETDLVAGMVTPKIEPPHRAATDIDPKLSKILMTALHRKRKRRPREAVDLYRQLKAYLAEHGVATPREALGRFLRDAVGVSGESRHRARGGTDGFVESDYHAPIEMSPTQRLQLQARRRKRWPIMVAASALVVAGAGAWWLSDDSASQPEGQQTVRDEASAAKKAAGAVDAAVAAPPEPSPAAKAETAAEDAGAAGVKAERKPRAKKGAKRKRRRRER